MTAGVVDELDDLLEDDGQGRDPDTVLECDTGNEHEQIVVNAGF